MSVRYQDTDATVDILSLYNRYRRNNQASGHYSRASDYVNLKNTTHVEPSNWNNDKILMARYRYYRAKHTNLNPVGVTLKDMLYNVAPLPPPIYNVRVQTRQN